MPAFPIKTSVTIIVDGTDISADLSPDLLSFSYGDKADGEADDISITLKDPEARWAGSWTPEANLKLAAYIIAVGGPTPGSLFCGEFYADSFRFSGAPNTVAIRAQSIPLDTPVRRKRKSRAWEKMDLRAIAAQIARENSLELFFDAQDTGQTLDRRDQDHESDLEFITKLAKDAGLSVKIEETRIVIYDKKAYEQKDPVSTLTLKASPILSWEFSSEHSERYKSVTVAYRDPQQKKKKSAASHATETGGTASRNPAVMTYTATDPHAPEAAQEYEEKKRAKSMDEARSMAKAKLRELNQNAVTGSITMVGDPSKAAGEVIALAGFGNFDGNWFIEGATHDVSGSGYTTRLELRKCQREAS